MTQVSIQYPRLIFRSRKNLVEINIPPRIGDLTKDQWMAFVGKLTRSLTDNQVLQLFYGLDIRIINRMGAVYQHHLLKMVPGVESIKPVSHFFIPTILNLKGPGNKLRNLSWAEFMFIDNYFRDAKRDDQALNKMIAVLYRRHIRGTERREAFDESGISAAAERISELPAILKLSVYYNWMAIREWLGINFTYLFQKSSDKKDQATLWIPIYEKAIIGDDLINSDKYANLPAIQVLKYLNNKLKENYKNGN